MHDLLADSKNGRVITKKRLLEIAAWCEAHITIHDVETGSSFPLRWNQVQKDLLKHSLALRLHNVTDGTIKARQMGSTIGLGALVIGMLVHVPGIVVAWVNLDEQGTRIVRRKLENMWTSARDSPGSNFPEVRRDSDDQLILSNGSVLVWEEAGGAPQTAGRAGRADTIDLAILCEMASWEYAEKTLTALKPAVNSTKGAFFIDSTPPEFEGQGEQYLQHIRAIRDKQVPGRLFFWPWWYRADYRADAPAQPPYTRRETWLMQRCSVGLYQIGWRRRMKADPTVGPRFKYVYPETIDEALSPKATPAFDLEVVESLSKRAASGEWPEHLTRSELLSLMPERLWASAPDPLLDASICRVWAPPVEGEDETEQEMQRSARGVDVRQWSEHLKRRRKRAGLGYTIGVDSADGGLESDHQAAAVIDPQGEIVALLRCKISVLQFASAVARLALWYEATTVVEINARSGALVHRYLAEPLGEKELRALGGHSALCEPLPKLEAWTANVKTRPEIEEVFLTMLNGLVEVPCEWIFHEMLHWDAVKRKARRGSQDDVLDALGIAWVARAAKTRKPAWRKTVHRLVTQRHKTAF